LVNLDNPLLFGSNKGNTYNGNKNPTFNIANRIPDTNYLTEPSKKASKNCFLLSETNGIKLGEKTNKSDSNLCSDKNNK